MFKRACLNLLGSVSFMVISPLNDLYLIYIVYGFLKKSNKIL
nr:MAG TPA: hypothetical protein [Caudoviricetes sp.]